jgi:hypothetical protein
MSAVAADLRCPSDYMAVKLKKKYARKEREGAESRSRE